MSTVMQINGLVQASQTERGSITKKRGSNRLYVDFYHRGVRIVKSTGLNDTSENRQKIQGWLDRVMARIANGTFIFAEAFPGASQEEKAFMPNERVGTTGRSRRTCWLVHTPSAMESRFYQPFVRRANGVTSGTTSTAGYCASLGK